MSFSSDAKRELCRLPLTTPEEKRAQLYGMLLFAGRFSPREIVFKTENRDSAELFRELLRELFDCECEKHSDFTKKLYKLSVSRAADCLRVFEAYGHSERDINLRVNRANIEDEGLIVNFLRGVFLSCGSVTSPDKGYHLELMVRRKVLAGNLVHLMGEIDVLSVKPKLAGRKGAYIVYIKGSDGICDFLGYIGAGNSVMAVVEASAYKDIINDLNRRQNSELSNIRKLADASARQVLAINKIKNTVGLDSLPEELRAIAELRLDNPEMSLKELAQNLGISRSGVNHRMERLLKLAQKAEEENI